jgi:SAM-dependent methyltransferase
MPFSVSTQLTPIVGFAERLRPKSVLDVGTGMGQYGFLLRNSLEALNLFEISGDKGWQRDRRQWEIVIDGIEGFPGYVTAVHNYAYSRLMIGDALELLPTLPNEAYEFVLAVDIVEHFSIEDARVFISECQRVSGRAVLMATPKEFLPQDVPANPLENHRSHWCEDDFRRLGFTEFLSDSASIIAVYRRSN